MLSYFKYIKSLLKEYVFPRLVLDISVFFWFLVILGTMASRDKIDWEWLAIVLTTYLMTIFSFVYNDMEDAEDDARSKYKYVPAWHHILLTIGIKNKHNTGGKRFKNPFAFKVMSRNAGYVWLLGIAIVSLVLSYIGGGLWASLTCLSCLIVGFGYSNMTIRFKSRLFLDLISHSYILAGAQIFLFMAITRIYFEVASLIILFGGVIFSMGSDLENEHRDFDEDMAVGIKNTASLLGESLTRTLSIFAKLTGILVIAVGIILRFSLY